MTNSEIKKQLYEIEERGRKVRAIEECLLNCIYDNSDDDGYFDCTGMAIDLYDAGVRKIDDDCAVITKDELKQYKAQAVKEFAENVKAKALSHCKTINCYELIFIEETIDDLLKEYENDK